MKSNLIVCALAGALCAPGAMAASASAEIDWSTLSVTFYNLSPGGIIEAPAITWSNESTWLWTSNDTAWDSESAANWTSALSVSSGAASATATADTLSVTSGSGTGWSDASISRYGDFTLTPYTLAVFSVDVAYATSSTGDFDSAYAGAYLMATGTGANGTGVQSNYSSIGEYDEFLGVAPPPADAGTLVVTFSNLSGAAIQGEFSAEVYAYAYTAPVPEPESYALFLAGLGLLGAVARRRR